MKLNFFLLTLMALSLPNILMGQSQPPRPVVDKSIRERVQLKPGDMLAITGEKASLTIKGWGKDYAEIQIIFSAEHTNAKVASREVEYMHYSLSRDKNTIDLRNAFILPASVDRIESKVRAAITLQVPYTLALKVYNKYGDVEFSDVSGVISVTIDFCDLMLTNVTGNWNIRASYSEVRGRGLKPAVFTSNDEESKYRLSLLGGAYTFKSKFGDIDLTLGSIQSLQVDASHTDVTLRPTDHSSFNYDLSNREGRIILPPQFEESTGNEQRQHKITLTQKPGAPRLNIKTSFNTITIQ